MFYIFGIFFFNLLMATSWASPPFPPVFLSSMDEAVAGSDLIVLGKRVFCGPTGSGEGVDRRKKCLFVERVFKGTPGRDLVRTVGNHLDSEAVNMPAMLFLQKTEGGQEWLMLKLCKVKGQDFRCGFRKDEGDNAVVDGTPMTFQEFGVKYGFSEKGH
jgi:hypothetical protein